MTTPTGPLAAPGDRRQRDAQTADSQPATRSAPARQRWRLVVSRPAPTEADARSEGGPRGWAAILGDAGLPLAGEAGGRGRVVPAAPLPLGIAGEREIVDLYLAGRRTAAEVRRGVSAALPPGWALVDLHDVWVGAPAAPAAVVAADYRVVIAGAPRWALEGAVLALVGAASLPRERRRERRVTEYDLRPLLLGLSVRGADGDGVVIAVRLRHAPDMVGRPEEVVAALGEPPAPPTPAPFDVRRIVRERLLMADDADLPGG